MEKLYFDKKGVSKSYAKGKRSSAKNLSKLKLKREAKLAKLAELSKLKFYLGKFYRYL